MNSYIGIDPGVTGAVAVLHPDGYEVCDWPGDEVAAAELVRRLLVTHPQPRMAAIEQAGAHPGQGVSSTFKFGVNFGIWRGILASFAIPFRTVRPQEWQKGLINKGDGKAGSLAVARRMFPLAELGRQKDHGRADALLIADWARRQG